jgi:hypothetical protein
MHCHCNVAQSMPFLKNLIKRSCFYRLIKYLRAVFPPTYTWCMEEDFICMGCRPSGLTTGTRFTKISSTLAPIPWIMRDTLLFERGTLSSYFTVFSPHIKNATSLAASKTSFSPTVWNFPAVTTWRSARYEASSAFPFLEANVNFCSIVSFCLHLKILVVYF